MTLNELKYITALADVKHFRKASELCFVSQPTLSIAIKKLEEELNVTLFERHKNNVIITPLGEIIITLARQILKQTEDIKKLASQSTDQTSELKIGAIYTLGPFLIPKLISIFQTIAPNTKLIFEENYTHVLDEKLQQGDLDIIFISLPYFEPNIKTEVLYHEDFVAAMSPNNALHSQEQIDLKTVKDETILLLGPGHCFRDQVLNAYPNLAEINYHSHHWQKTLEGSSLETIRYMVASGTGITILPKTATTQHDKLLIKPLKPPVPNRTVIMAWRDSFYQKDLIQALIKNLKTTTLEGTYP